MPVSSTQLQHEIDRALKWVDNGILEFSACWKRLKADVASQEVHLQHENLKKLSDDLQQYLPQLQSLSRRSGVRKAQKERLRAAQASIDHELENFNAFEQKLKERELSNSGGFLQSTANADDAQGGKDDSSAAADVHMKVQWDQVLRETMDDSEMVEEFICKICQVHVVGCEPKLTRCSHLFCGDCITKWFEAQPRSLSWAQRAQAAGRVPCPVCKEPLQPQQDLFPLCPTGGRESALLWRLLSGVKLVCANSGKCRADGKCTWTGDYGSYQKHIQTCRNVTLDGEVVSAESPTASSAKRGTSRGEEQQRNLINPCDNCKDVHEHEVHIGCLGERTDPGLAGYGIHPAPCQTVVALEAYDSCVRIPDSPTTSAQPAQQQAVEQSKQDRRAIQSFIATGHSQLSIEAGDSIEILNEHPSGWTFGRKVLGGLKGWFPNWVVALE